MKILVTTEWLARELDNTLDNTLADPLAGGDLVILDASAHLPDAGRDAASDFAARHIRGARFLNLPGLKDETSPVPAALPRADQFEQRMRELGITASDRIVLYDDSKLRSSARAFFVFRMFGQRNVAILDGGFAKWLAESRAVESGTGLLTPGDYRVPQDDRSRVRSKADIIANLATGVEQIVDARDALRFSGETRDMVHNLAGGHIPGAFNLPYPVVLNDDGTFKDRDALRNTFEAAGIDLTRPVTGSCGSGMTASVLLFALELLGEQDTALYDGSWSEWGADPDTPKETGAGSGR